MKEKLSVVIMVKNEEERLANTLESVKWADEIIVVDDQSTDKTVEVARRYTDKVFTGRAKKNEGEYRKWSYTLAKNPWVLSVDADEIVTPELKEDIVRVLSNSPVENGFTVQRRNYIGNYWVKYGGWYPAPQLKLFRKDKFRHEEVEIHARAFMDDPCGHLKSDLIHYSYRDISDLVRKLNNQTTWEAQKHFRLGKKMTFGKYFWRTIDRFMRSYVGKKGRKDGFWGLVVAFNSGAYQILSYFKYREMVLNEKSEAKFDRRTGNA